MLFKDILNHLYNNSRMSDSFSLGVGSLSHGIENMSLDRLVTFG